MPSIVFESVHKIFRQNRFFFLQSRSRATHALRNISFSIEAGEVLGFLGPNGSGKSTTLKLISTILLPDRGRVVVQGHDTRREGQRVRRSVGFALASERSFFPRLTVRENLEFFAALEEVPRRGRSENITRVLSRVGLIDAVDKQAMKLSSGMYQRLAIARALIKNPPVLLLDEPTRSLDLIAAGELWGVIRELSTHGITIVLATHNFEEAAEVCGRVALLHRGELLEGQPCHRLHAQHLHEFYREMASGNTQSVESLQVPA